MLAESILIGEEKGKYPEGIHWKRFVKPGMNKWLMSLMFIWYYLHSEI